MNTQTQTNNVPTSEIVDLRDLLSSEIVLIGGGETVVCGI